ncbi:hypothetical protein ACFL59_15605 [Planctomycetota bacterium]
MSVFAGGERQRDFVTVVQNGVRESVERAHEVKRVLSVAWRITYGNMIRAFQSVSSLSGEPTSEMRRNGRLQAAELIVAAATLYEAARAVGFHFAEYEAFEDRMGDADTPKSAEARLTEALCEAYEYAFDILCEGFDVSVDDVERTIREYEPGRSRQIDYDDIGFAAEWILQSASREAGDPVTAPRDAEGKPPTSGESGRALFWRLSDRGWLLDAETEE